MRNDVNKDLILFHDEWEQKPDVMNAWQEWFASVGDHLVDSGNPLGAAIGVTKQATTVSVPPMARRPATRS